MYYFTGRMVHVLGMEKALELLKMTREKEANGGILTYVSFMFSVFPEWCNSV